MAAMKAARIANGELTIQDVESPTPAKGVLAPRSSRVIGPTK